MGEWLAEAKKRCEQAMPSPWYVKDDPEPKYLPLIARCLQASIMGHPDLRQGIAWTVGLGDPADKNNAEFIAHARTDLPKALALLERAQAVIQAAQAIYEADDVYVVNPKAEVDARDQALSHALDAYRKALADA